MDELLENQAWDLCVKINNLIAFECFGLAASTTPTARKKKLVYAHARAYVRFLRRQDNLPPLIGDDLIHTDDAPEYVSVNLIEHREYIEINKGVLDTAFFLIEKLKIKNTQDEQRIDNRQDRVDKKAFQAAVTANIDVYSTKADAISDLNIKPQFGRYGDATLRKWLTPDVWTKPKQNGRPKKK